MAHSTIENPLSLSLLWADPVRVAQRGWEPVDYSEMHLVPKAFLQHIEQSVWMPDGVDISTFQQQGRTIIPPSARKETVPHMNVFGQYDQKWWRMELDLLSLPTDPEAEKFLKNEANPFYQQIAGVGVGERQTMMIRIPNLQLVDAARKQTIVQTRNRRDSDTRRDVTGRLAIINGARGEYLYIQHHTDLIIQFDVRPRDK